MPRGLLVVLLGVTACAGSTAPERLKPGAPASATLATRPASDGNVEIELTVTARADLTDVILEIHLPPGARYASGSLVRPVGALAAGQTATLVAEVSASGRGEIGGGARLARRGHHGGVVAAALLAGDTTSRAKDLVAPSAGRTIDTVHGQVTEVRQ